LKTWYFVLLMASIIADWNPDDFLDDDDGSYKGDLEEDSDDSDDEEDSAIQVPVLINPAFRQTRATHSLQNEDVDKLGVDDATLTKLFEDDMDLLADEGEDLYGNILGEDFKDEDDDEYTPTEIRPNKRVRDSYQTRTQISYADKRVDELCADEKTLDDLMEEIGEDEDEPDFDKDLYRNFLRSTLELQPDISDRERNRRQCIEALKKSEPPTGFPFRVYSTDKVCRLLQNMMQLAHQVHQETGSTACQEILNRFNEFPKDSLKYVNKDDHGQFDPRFALTKPTVIAKRTKERFLFTEDMLIVRGLLRYSSMGFSDIKEAFFPNHQVNQIVNRYRNQSGSCKPPNLIKSTRAECDSSPFPISMSRIARRRFGDGIIKFSHDFKTIAREKLPHLSPNVLQLYYITLVKHYKIMDPPVLKPSLLKWTFKEDQELLKLATALDFNWNKVAGALSKEKCRKKECQIRYQDVKVAFYFYTK